jgi:cytochrome c-type protein NapB
MKKILSTLLMGVVCSVSVASASVNSKACAGCHGADWSKKALGKSLKVSEMTHSEIAAALNGYKDGSYGGVMRGLMKGQIAKYSTDEITEFSKSVGIEDKPSLPDVK